MGITPSVDAITGNSPSVRRRRRRRRPEDDAPPPPRFQPIESFQRLHAAEAASRGTLPPSVVVAMAESRLHKDELKRAARDMARRFDLTPDYLLEPVDKKRPLGLYVDPVTGFHITYNTAKRLIKPYEGDAIKEILTQATAGTPDKTGTVYPGAEDDFPKLRKIPGQAPISPERVRQVMQTFAPVDGDRLSFAEAVGAAAQIARTKIDTEKLRENIAWLSRVRDIDPLRAVTSAAIATQYGVSIASLNEAVSWALAADDPKAQQTVAESLEEAQEFRTAKRELAQIRAGVVPDSARLSPEEIQAIRREHPITADAFIKERQQALLNQRATELNEKIQQGPNLYERLGAQLADQINGTEADVVKAAQRVSETVEIEKRAIENSMFGKALGAAMYAIDRASGVVMGAARMGFEAVKAGSPIAVASDMTDAKIRTAHGKIITPDDLLPGGRADLEDAWQDTKDIFWGRTTFGQEVFVEELGLPKWTAPVADLALGIAMDPFLLAGRAVKAARMSKTIFGGNTEKYLGFVNEFLTKERRVFGGKRIGAWLTDKALEGDSPSAFYDALGRLLTPRFGGPGLHHQVSYRVYEYAQQARKAGRAVDDIAADVDVLLLHAFTGKGQNELTRAVQTHLDELNVKYAELENSGALAEGAPKTQAVKDFAEAERALAMLGEWEMLMSEGTRFATEIPRIQRMWTPKGFVHQVLAEKMGDTRATRALQALFNHRPQGAIVWDVPGMDPVKQLRAHMKASRVISKQEQDSLAHTFAEYLAGPRTRKREGALVGIVEEVNRRIAVRIGKDFGLDPKTTNRILQEARGYNSLGFLAGGEQQAFGVRAILDEGEVARVIERDPLLSSQLPNEWSLVDPLEIRRALTEAQGASKRLLASAKRVLGQTTEGVLVNGKFRTRKQLDGIVKNRQIRQNLPASVKTFDDVVEMVRKFKGRQIAQIEREEIRKILQAMPKELRQAAGKAARGDDLTGQVLVSANRVTVKGVPVSLPLTKFFLMTKDIFTRDFLRFWKPMAVIRPAYIWRVPGLEEQARFLAALDLTTRIESSKIGAKVLKAAGRKGNTITYEMDDTLGGTGKRTVTEEFELPGLIPDEPLAASGGNVKREIGGGSFHSFIDAMVDRYKGGSNGARWTDISRDQPTFYEFWAHGLSKQYGVAPEGRKILAGIAAGKSEGQIIDEVVAFLEGESGRYLAKRLVGANATPEQLRSKVRKAVQVARDYTGASRSAAYAAGGARKIAEAALDDADNLAALLRAMPDTVAPEAVHGMAFALNTSHGNAFTRGIDRAAELILQMPTNALSRQPFFKAWYSKSEQALLTLVTESGATITPEMRVAIREQARDFAIHQVNRVMFDFRDQSRFGELFAFVMPFFGPYTEAFVVWGKLLKNNPAALGYVRLASNYMHESGFIREDPDTGEKVIPLTWMQYAAPLVFAMGALKAKSPGAAVASLAAGTYTYKAMDELHLDGVAMMAPLNSFNLFFSSAFTVPTGNFAGDLPLPIPSFSPPAMYGLQRLVESDSWPLGERMRALTASWAFQHGPTTTHSMIPMWLNRRLAAWAPEWMRNEQDLQATEFLRLQQMVGIGPQYSEPDERGIRKVMNRAPDYSESEWAQMDEGARRRAWDNKMATLARQQAQQFAGARSFFSLLFPASPIIQFPTEELNREWRELSETRGVEEAREIFLKEHPDLTLFTQAKTMWAKENESPVPIPATQAVEQLLRDPEIKRLAKVAPEWVWAMIPREVRSGEYDPGSFFAQIAQGHRTVLTPEEFLARAGVTEFWDAYFMLREPWDERDEWLKEEKGLSESDPEWVGEKEIWFDAPIRELKSRFPPQVRGLLEEINTANVDPKVVKSVRILLKTPAFMETEVGKALGIYMEARDKIRVEMRRLGISSIETKYAEEMGFTARYERLVDSLKNQSKDFEIAYNIFFDRDLRGIASYTDRVWGKLPQATRDEYINWRADFRKNQDRIDVAETSIELTKGFARTRALIDRAEDMTTTVPGVGKINPATLWWKSLRQDEQEDYRMGLITRPYVYLSHFDRTEVLGMKSNEAVEAVLRGYNDAVLDINRDRARAEARGETFRSGDRYDAINERLKDYAKKIPLLGEQMRQANDWTYRAKLVVPALREPENYASAPYWRAFLDAVDKVQRIANRAEMHGEEDFDRDKKAAYIQNKRRLLSFKGILAKQSPEFASEWKALAEDERDEFIIDYFVPASWWPIGGFEWTRR